MDSVMELNDVFKVDGQENMYLKGSYKIEPIINQHFNVELDEVIQYHAKAVYYTGVVLSVQDSKVSEYISKIMEATYILPEEFNKNDTCREQMKWGTICPTKEKIMEYDNHEFYLYGRYIYGYDKDHVTFKSSNVKFKLETESIIKKKDMHDHYYAFMIKEKGTDIVKAFGLYA